MIKTFITKHTDLIEVIFASATGMSILLTEIELILKVMIGFVTLGFITFKWICAIQDRKKKTK